MAQSGRQFILQMVERGLQHESGLLSPMEAFMFDETVYRDALQYSRTEAAKILAYILQKHLTSTLLMKRVPISDSPSFRDIFGQHDTGVGGVGVACLSFLTNKDLNEFAMASQLARLCRNNPELDQSRQGKISIARRSNLSQIEFCQRLVGGWGHQRPLEQQRPTRTLCLEGMGNLSLSTGLLRYN